MKLPDAQYLKSPAQHEQEQQETVQQAAKPVRKTETETAQTAGKDKSFILACRYADFAGLTESIGSELIPKTAVHKPEKCCGRRPADTEVFFAYEGKIHIPINTENSQYAVTA